MIDMNSTKAAPADMKRYSVPAIAAHWLTFLLLLGSFSMGFYMTDLAMSPDKLRFYSWHKWAGVTIFLLTVLRLAWRLMVRPPALPAMPTWEKRAADLSHGLLYFSLFAMPVSGWLMSSAKGFTTVYFGVLPLPDLLSKNPELGEVLEEAHEILAFLMLGLIALHALAALKHHFLDRDSVLTRMVPGLKLPTPKD